MRKPIGLGSRYVVGVNEPSSTENSFDDPSPPIFAPGNDGGSQAVIDIGSNTCRLTILVPEPNGRFRIQHEEKVVLKLIRSIGGDGTLSADAESGLAGVLADFGRIATAAGVSTVNAVGTAALRLAKNPDQILVGLCSARKINLRIIDGETEARLGFAAAVESLAVHSGTFVDIGGGSTEFVEFSKRRLHSVWSVPIGCLSLSDKYLGEYPPADELISSARRYVTKTLRARVGGVSSSETIVGIGGTIRNVAKIHRGLSGFKFSRIHGYEMSSDDVAHVFETVSSLSVEGLCDLQGLNSTRVDSIVGGTLVLSGLMEYFGARNLVISGRGIRDSLAVYGTGLPPRQLASVSESRSAAVKATCNQFASWDAGRSRRRAAILQRLMDELSPLLPARFNQLAIYAATLADVGLSFDYYNRWTHAANVCEASVLSGFSHRDIAVISGVLRAARKHSLPLSKYGSLLNEEDRRLIRCLGVLVSLADGIEWRSGRKFQSVQVTLAENTLVLKSDLLQNWGFEAGRDALHQLMNVDLALEK